MSIKILLINEDSDVSRAKKAQLEQLGNFKVTIAGDADMGIRFAKKMKPDLILLDVLMPDKDGFEVLRLLKSKISTAAIPVVMFTGVDHIEAKLRAAEEYSEGYILKTADNSTIVNTILAVLSKRPTF